MSKNAIKAGFFIAGTFPGVFIFLAAISTLMHGCSLGGSGGPAGGCKALGISFDWLISFATPAFVISFFTVPIGLLILFVGLILPGESS